RMPATAENYIREYETSYQKAVAELNRDIAAGREADACRYKLGRLYFGHGDFEKAIGQFRLVRHPDAAKYLALALYKSGDFTGALQAFEDQKDLDDESRYYLGMTCEKLNLFDKALATYGALRSGAYAPKAQQRILLIERQESALHIRDIDPAVAKMIAEAPGADRYPQAGALILYSDEKTEVTADDKEITTLHYIVKILNERGKEEFAEMPTGYDSTYEKVTLEYARTIKPDGKVLEVGSRHIRDVTKYLNFPLYSNARVFIISFPEIAAGSTIEYKLKIVCNQLINKKDFVSGTSLQTSEPVIDSVFTLAVAGDKTVAIKTLNASYNDFGATLTPEAEHTGTATVYRWRFRDIPQIVPEAGMPPSTEINPALLFSTFKSWQEVYQWWWDLVKDKMLPDQAIKAKVRDLVSGARSDEEKARAIYTFCAKDIRYVAVEYGQAGYEPHLAGDIFKNKYGDCKDQAVLLVTMLKEAGLSAWPVLIGTRDAFNLQKDFPATLFNHAIAVVSLNGKSLFLDPTAETASFGDLPSADQDRNVFVCTKDGFRIETTPLFTAAHNLVRQSTDITVKPDESIAARKQIEAHGIYEQAQRYWLLYTLPDVVEEQIATRVQDISIGARLSAYKVENLNNLNKPVTLSYSFDGPEFFTPAGRLRILPQLASADTGLVAKERRRYPIEFGFLDTKVTEVNCLLPPGFVVQYMPEAIVEDSPWLGVRASYQRQGARIVFRQTVETRKTRVSQDEYPAFKAFLERVAKKVKQRVVLSSTR
ncbi:MAG: DUF3857 domain-containing protein, partial [Candidatus Omnitrophica bacterium]|nr:DUF3857 domain-containing protein [Candidatus Omnitrophota bacterium]